MSKKEKPREPEREDQIYKDKNGKPLNGQYFIAKPIEEGTVLYDLTELNYFKGKIHGEPAICYHDGLEETWENGKFLRIKNLPYPER